MEVARGVSATALTACPKVELQMRQSKKALPLSEAASLLQPGSVLLLGTCLSDGRPNVMALAWYTLLQDNPMRLACVLRKDRESFAALRDQGECVLNIPTADQIEQVLDCGTLSAREQDKLARHGWTTCTASQVGVPLVVESHAHLECRVVEQQEMGDCAVFVLEILAASANQELNMEALPTLPGNLLLRVGNEIQQRRGDLERAMLT